MTSKTGRASFSSSSAALLAVPYSITPGELHNFDLTASSQNVFTTGSTSDPAYLFSQLKSTEWIQRYGLKSQKLTFDQILQQIAFKRVESFDPVIGKTVSAKYAGNLYHEVQHDNGDRYVLTCRPDKLRQYHHRLTQMLSLLRKRLMFITNGSRRLFGILGEPSVCLICDCKTFDHRIFNQFQSALTSLFKEQISKIKRFNIIWVSNDNEQFREQPIDVSASNIDQAIDWICDRKCPRNKVSISSTSEAVLKAFNNNVHSIYLISEGDSSDLAREILRDNIVKTRLSSPTPIPFHVISLFCHNNDTQVFLRSIAQSVDGSYFCYKIKNEISDLKAPSNLNDPTRIKLQDDKLQVGTNALTPLPEYPLDITLMYKEIIQCQSIIDRLEKILGFVRDENSSPVQTLDDNETGENNLQRSMLVQSSALLNSEENDMSSEDWLKIFGIEVQKLDFFSVLQSAAFRHCDGVVTLLKPPGDSEEVTAETPANRQDKLINAIYCDQFAHVAWPDGTIRHVHVTPELHRDYERRIRTLLGKIKARLFWLKKGSRDVFGTVIENNIYVLIDTSKSMEHHLSFVKEKLRLLIQDQLFAKERVNMVAFNSKINPWRDRLAKITDSAISSQLHPWIDGLTAEGSTNTLAALRFALADPATEAIYLLSDGRPDQNERHILSQVQYRQIVPIHTIAFNCQDQTANQFLYNLSKQTGGRFHAFKYGFEKETSVEIPESEDVGNLKREFTRGEKELERIAALRDECLGKAWSRETVQQKTSKYKTRQTNKSNSASLPLRSRSTSGIAFGSTISSMSQRITNKKKRSTANPKPARRTQSVTNITDHGSRINLNPNQWLLPETKEFLKANENKSDTENEYQVEVKPVEIKKLQTPYDEVRSYLKKNSLLVKGLTIFDVLYPTSVTVKDPRHVQVIDRYVLAKVWDDILPLTYGSYVGKLRLVNHYAVDLEKYEANLRELISNYYKFTSDFIWRHLSEDDKKKLGPSLYWNSLTKDEQNRITQDIPKEEYTSQSALEVSAWEKLNDNERNDLLRKSAVYEDTNQILLKNTLKEAELDSAVKGVTRMDVEIHRAIKFLQISTDLRQLQKRADADSKPPDEYKPKPRKPSVERNYGQRVICRFDDDGFFYPGKIQKHPTGRTIVQFDMGVEQRAIGHILLPTNGAIAQPNLFVKDCVLVRQMNGHREFWAPGIVVGLPSPGARPPPLYTVQIYTPSPHQVHVPRRDMLKISLGLFQRTLLYLQNIDHAPIPPTGNHDGLPSSSLENILRKELEPLRNKVEHLRKSHSRRCNQLQLTLEGQMAAIKYLQERPSGTSARDISNQTVIISVKPPITPKEEEAIKPSITPTEESIQPNTKVYTIWLDDDALVYQGIVVQKENHSNSYIVRRDDLPNNLSTISRDDIYLQEECKPLETFKSILFALIQYPKDSRQCWSPALILPHNPGQSQIQVRFYDCIDQDLSPTENVISISREKFEFYATARIELENKLLGQVIVGLDDETQTFLLGSILERTKSGHDYMIRWSNKNENQQSEEHLFGAFTRRNQHQLGNRVLAMDKEEYIYKPAKVIGHSNDWKELTVRFIAPEETERESEVPADTTFVITDRYYQLFIKDLYE